MFSFPLQTKHFRANLLEKVHQLMFSNISSSRIKFLRESACACIPRQLSMFSMFTHWLPQTFLQFLYWLPMNILIGWLINIEGMLLDTISPWRYIISWSVWFFESILIIKFACSNISNLYGQSHATFQQIFTCQAARTKITCRIPVWNGTESLTLYHFLPNIAFQPLFPVCLWPVDLVGCKSEPASFPTFFERDAVAPGTT